MKNARETKPYARLTGAKLTAADLFHLAPLVCLKFRGRQLAGAEADQVTKGALANYVVNTEKGLTSKPQLRFAEPHPIADPFAHPFSSDLYLQKCARLPHESVPRSATFPTAPADGEGLR